MVRAWKVFCYTLGTLATLGLALQCWFFAQVLWWRYHPGDGTLALYFSPNERRFDLEGDVADGVYQALLACRIEVERTATELGAEDDVEALLRAPEE